MDETYKELSEFLLSMYLGYKFMFRFRNRMWDGKIRLFSQKTKEIYFGLYPYTSKHFVMKGLSYCMW